MSILIIFWASVMMLVLFLICTLCKIFKAALQAGLEVGKKILKILVYVAGGALVLGAAFDLLKGLFQGNFLSTLFEVIVNYGSIVGMLLIMGVVVVFLFSFLGELVYLVILPVELIIGLFEKIVELTEKGYLHFLNVIDTNVEKC